MHEYSVIGHSRATVGRHLGTVAGFVAAACALGMTIFLDLIERFGLADWIPAAVLLPVSAAMVYPIGHKLFDLWAWRWPPMLHFLTIPNLNGNWTCEGQTMNIEGKIIYEWKATVCITQTWEKIKVYLDTGSSQSSSVAASLVKEPGRGYLLMYSYRNEPKIGEKDLQAHVGYCELLFNEKFTAATGDYFNNKGRVTFGRMTLKRGKA